MDRKEQIEQARRLIATGISEDLVAVLHRQFPELKESEDERIRKYILHACKECIEANDRGLELSMDATKKLAAYLERQKEQRNYRKLYEDIAKSDWFKENYVGKSLGEEQKPAEWSEKEEKDIQEASDYLRDYANNCVQGGNSKLYLEIAKK